MSTVSLEDALDTPDPQTNEKVEQAPQEQAAPEPVVAQDGTGDEPAAPPAAEQSEQPVKMVPVAAIEAERRKRQQAEKEREALMERMAELMARQAQPAQQPKPEAQQQPGIPDPITDPEGHNAYWSRQLRSNFVNQGYHIAKVQYGADRVDTALKAAKEAGVSQHFAWKADDPWGELIQWYDRRLVHTEYGTSPDSVEEKVLAKYGLNRAELLAQRQAAAAGQAPVVAAQPVRSPVAPPPTSLASVPSAAPRASVRGRSGPASLEEILG